LHPEIYVAMRRNGTGFGDRFLVSFCLFASSDNLIDPAPGARTFDEQRRQCQWIRAWWHRCISLARHCSIVLNLSAAADGAVVEGLAFHLRLPAHV
jgi:hypothetical protein